MKTDEERFWNRARTLAAQLVAEDELTDVEIAKRCKHERNWLAQLKNDVRFRARVKFTIEQLRAAIADRGIVERRNRVDAANERWEELKQRKRVLESLIRARAEDPLNRDVAGGTTGLLARTVKAIGHGGVDVWELDSALLSELRGIDALLLAHEKQAAQELGQWTEKRELTGRNGGPVRLLWDDGEPV